MPPGLAGSPACRSQAADLPDTCARPAFYAYRAGLPQSTVEVRFRNLAVEGRQVRHGLRKQAAQEQLAVEACWEGEVASLRLDQLCPAKLARNAPTWPPTGRGQQRQRQRRRPDPGRHPGKCRLHCAAHCGAMPRA